MSIHSKFLSYIFLCIISGLLFNSECKAQVNISAQEWNDDLEFLQNTIHKDYSFLFKKTTKSEFDGKVEALKKAIPSLSEHEIIVGFAKLISSFEYGHTSMRLGGERINFHQLPLNLYNFKDGIFIEGIHKDYEALLGSKVIEVEGMPVEEVLATLKPVFPSENDQFYKGYGLNAVMVPEILHAQGITETPKTDIEFTLEKDGVKWKKEITASQGLEIPRSYGFTQQNDDWLSFRNQEKTPYYIKNLDKHYYYEYLPESKTVYVRYSQVFHDEGETIHDFYGRVFEFIDKNEVEKLVLDVRLNGGGDNFNNKVLITKIIETKKINQVGNLFVIIGRRTFSACQNLINEVDTYTNAIFVGEPSGENVNFYGDNRVENLPNSGLPLRMSWAWWQDKPEWLNADWTEPHLAVELSSEDYKQNEDPILDRALEFKQDNFILDPIDYLSGLFVSRQVDLLASEAQRLVQDPDYAFVDFEREFEKIGLMLLNSKQLEGAMFVFDMNTKFFPESLSSKYHFAEVLLASGKTEDALALFTMVSEKDAEGEFGGKALSKIKELSSK